MIKNKLEEKDKEIQEAHMEAVMLPRKLTAANGAKALLMGEFFEVITITCPVCDGDENTIIDCFDCGGSGEITTQTAVSWTTIKAIYNKIVEHYGNK